MQIQVEKRNHEHSQALKLSLHALQVSMDPLIASQTYNNRFCPLTRLPEELLLNVINFLRGDRVTLCCLRITSRVFLRILHNKSEFWIDPIIFAPSAFLRHNLKLQFRRLLQRDGRCGNCRRWNDAHVHIHFDACKFKGPPLRRNPPFSGCEYRYSFTTDCKTYCSACDTDHDVYQFPMAYQEPPQSQIPGPQVCLGQQGSVQLCEHVHITWASIKAHIDNWRRPPQQQGGGEESGARWNWQMCLESFKIECKDPIHDIRCTNSEAPTWPRARLGTSASSAFRAPEFVVREPEFVVLYLEWTPHGRLDELTPVVDGRIPAPQLRDLFRKFRRLGPANLLYPPGYPQTLPEMACLRPSFPIHYNMGENRSEEDAENLSSPSPSSSSFPSPSSHRRGLSPHLQSLNVRASRGGNSRMLDISAHYLKGGSGTNIACQCLTVSYQKGITVCRTSALRIPAIKLVPSHDWLHEMDTSTYPPHQAEQFRPQCRDESCANYYRRRKDDYCHCGDRSPSHRYQYYA